MILQDLYETEYGIYDHLSAREPRPLASVAMHPCEDVNTGSLLEEAFKTYVSKGIKDTFGISLIEFMELPIDIIAMLIKIADDELAKKSKTMADIENTLRK